MAMKEGFGKGRRALIGFSVLSSVGVAIVLWAVANYIFTRPNLRTSFDMSPGAQFTISPATKKLIASIRDKKTVLHIDTLFLPAGADPWGLQERVLGLTQTLLSRISYLGGEKIRVKNLDYQRDIKDVKAMGATKPNIVQLRYGKRKRVLQLLTQGADSRVRSDFADIQNPDLEGPKSPGKTSRPVLRAYKGEEALASALKELLSEEVLKIYWTTNLGFRPETPQMSSFVYDLKDNGFEHHLIDLGSEAIPKDCDLLFMIQPDDELRRDSLDRVQSYLKGGGRVLMTVSYDENLARQYPTQLLYAGLLKPLGLSLGNSMVLNGIPDPAGGSVPRYGIPECSLLRIRAGGLNPNHPVTGPMAKAQRYVDMAQARSIHFTDKRPKGTFADFLLHTNRYSWEESLGPQSPMFRYQPGSEQALSPRTVAATVEVGKESRFALVSGITLFSALPGQAGRFYDGNRDFALNLVNWLVKRDRLVTVRSRDYRAGRLEVAPQGLTRIKTFLVIILPLVFLGLAFFMLFWRRRA